MLEGLDRIDWERLTHANGFAGEVPGWIRELTSDDAAVRERAFGLLEGNICHQGSRYRASARPSRSCSSCWSRPGRKTGCGSSACWRASPSATRSGTSPWGSIRACAWPRSRPWAGRRRSNDPGRGARRGRGLRARASRPLAEGRLRGGDPADSHLPGPDPGCGPRGQDGGREGPGVVPGGRAESVRSRARPVPCRVRPERTGERHPQPGHTGPLPRRPVGRSRPPCLPVARCSRLRSGWPPRSRWP